MDFILETNGILLSENKYIHDLETMPNPPYVRFSLKAGRNLFSTITGAPLETSIQCSDNGRILYI
ncbi:MAG: hypothetical protein ACFE8U_13810 [Candidatus Hermodarchaeota archaeon]